MKLSIIQIKRILILVIDLINVSISRIINKNGIPRIIVIPLHPSDLSISIILSTIKIIDNIN